MLMSIVSGKQNRQTSYFFLRLFFLMWATVVFFFFFFWLLNDRESRYWIIYYYLLSTVIWWWWHQKAQSLECWVTWVPAAPPPRTISSALDSLHLTFLSLKSTTFKTETTGKDGFKCHRVLQEIREKWIMEQILSCLWINDALLGFHLVLV